MTGRRFSGFIQRELDEIGVALRKVSDPECYARLYAAQQGAELGARTVGVQIAVRLGYGHSGRLRRLSTLSVSAVVLRYLLPNLLTATMTSTSWFPTLT